MNSEADLLRLAREGDPWAAEEIYTKYLKQSRPVLGLLRRYLVNPEDREELLHEIYLQLMSGTNSFRGEARLTTYIYQVARITILQKYRRENTLKRGRIYRTMVEASQLPGPIGSSPEYAYSVKEAREILHEMIQRLPESYREVLHMRVLQDLSYDEIARKLELPINTVSTRIHKGKKLLALMLKARGIEEVFDF